MRLTSLFFGDNATRIMKIEISPLKKNITLAPRWLDGIPSKIIAVANKLINQGITMRIKPLNHTDKSAISKNSTVEIHSQCKA